jgi:hypothetical protein
MTDAIATAARTPIHLWVVGAIGVLWNGFGAYDYVMSHIGGEAYLRAFGMTDPQIAYFNAMPAWMTAAWAVGVWGAALGTVLLLLRSRWALHCFAASLAGLLLSLVHTHLLSEGGRVMGMQGAIMNLVITAGCVFFLWYAFAMTRRGLLR